MNAEKEIEEVKITIYKDFKKKQEENNFLPPWDGTKMLRQFILDIVANNPEYQHVNTDILYRDLLLLYYRKEKSSSNTKIYRKMLLPVVSNPLFVHAVFWGLCFFFVICGTKNTNLHPWIIFVAVVFVAVWLVMFFCVRKKRKSSQLIYGYLVLDMRKNIQKQSVLLIDSIPMLPMTKPICFSKERKYIFC